MIILKNICNLANSIPLHLKKQYFCIFQLAHIHSERNGDNTDKAGNVTQLGKESKQRSLHIAVIGVPNVGKSTFINNLIHHRVCPTSSKVHTTRDANTAICTSKNTQFVLFDTPGLVTEREMKRHNLQRSFLTAYKKAIRHADVIAVLHDVSNTWNRNELHSTVVDTLKAYSHLPSFLVLNKIDTLKSKRILLDLIRKLTNGRMRSTSNQLQQNLDQNDIEILEESPDDQNKSARKPERSWEHFEDIFMVSSITGDGLDRIYEYLIQNAEHRAWRYPSTCFTDEKPEHLVVESVRARLLDYLPQEIPYNLTSEIEYYSEEKNAIYASVLVTTPTTRIERLICGESNGRLRQITERVTSDLVETFGKPISLTISTRSKSNKKDK